MRQIYLTDQQIKTNDIALTTLVSYEEKNAKEERRFYLSPLPVTDELYRRTINRRHLSGLSFNFMNLDTRPCSQKKQGSSSFLFYIVGGE